MGGRKINNRCETKDGNEEKNNLTVLVETVCSVSDNQARCGTRSNWYDFQ